MGDGTRYEWIEGLSDIVAGAGGDKTNDAKEAVTFLNEFGDFIAKLIKEIKNLMNELGLSL